MTLSEADIRAIARRAADNSKPPLLLPWATEMRRMIKALADLEFQPARAAPLVQLCEAGARYGWCSLEAACDPGLLARISPRAKASLRRDLRGRLERLTRPCFELQRTSVDLVIKSIGILAQPEDPKLVDRMFLGDKPSHRLFPLFREFPVLPRLWSQMILQWRECVTELLSRFVADRRALADAFLGEQPAGMIVNLRCDMSDPHNRGRTVMELQFEAGAVIYKPRTGNGEWEWSSLLEWMNARSFRPRLRAGRVLRRKGYCWMERMAPGPPKSRSATRRFYERMGAIIGAAYLLKAVDCHRDNLIAAGENPILVDADALWHVSPGSRGHTPLDLLSRMGFFPNSNSRSLQSRSSVLSRDEIGLYQGEMMKGFGKAWECLLGTGNRRRAFAIRVRRIRCHKRRSIYRATEKYAAIRLASIQPAALRSGIERHLLITRLSSRNGLPAGIIKEEIDALARLDIPYFVRGSKEPISFEEKAFKGACEALRQLLA